MQPTIEEIRDQATRSPLYFSRGTLAFFGQTLHSFQVITSPSGRVFIYAKMYADSHFMGMSFREWTGEDLITPPELSGMPRLDTVKQIKFFVRHH